MVKVSSVGWCHQSTTLYVLGTKEYISLGQHSPLILVVTSRAPYSRIDLENECRDHHFTSK